MTQEMFVQNPRRQGLKIFQDALANIQKLQGLYDENGALIMPFIIRAHKALSTTSSKYTFDLGIGTSALLQPENKLQKSDVAMITQVALGIQKYDPASPDFNQPILHAPDPIYHGVNPGKALEKVYQGKSTLKTGSQIRIDGLSNLVLRYNPGDGFAGTLAAPTDFPQYGPEDVNRGFFDLGGYPILDGELQNQWEVELATGDLTNIVDGATAANSNNLVLLLLGWVYRGQVGGGVSQCF
ncbi:MAG: hypothetical protein K1X68_13665 [Saprospiraceae bacterium]|nr:hypothetical protein [Saprospiraceae bacterium]HMW39299.1 hypothetical protein [Saprospiraceae bacterium]HMX89067.1 hypothetical protein [Saprospiraceae bacterium]HMZ40938.1 hypothetical protein [Saprospiraceae bacterium]HNC37642.1 hypothetical protein [Saprospiraceae bacterium]